MNSNYKNTAIEIWMNGGSPQGEAELRGFFEYLIKHHPKAFLDACVIARKPQVKLVLTEKQIEIGELGRSNLLQAIKMHRAEYGSSLYEAKEEAERLRDILGGKS